MTAYIYLDNNATTPIDPRVLDEMLPWLKDGYANAASNHAAGRRAKAAVENARAQVAALLGAGPEEIVFTSGATEANNLAIKGVARTQVRARHLVTSRIEHKAVLDTMRALEAEGFEVTWLDPSADGLIEVSQVMRAVREDTALVSLMLANNEIGTLNPIADVAAALQERGIPLHCDATQGLTCVALDVHAGVALASLSAHKIYGPKGVGALFVRKRPRVDVAAEIHGGGHERGLRSGTLNVAGIVGFGAAAALALAEREHEATTLRALRDRLLEKLAAALPRIEVNGSLSARHPGNLSVAFLHVESRRLLEDLDSVLAASSGSACTAASLEPSHVLRGLGVGHDRAQSTLRLSVGRFNTEEEIDRAAGLIIDAVRRLRAQSPLWDEGA